MALSIPLSMQSLLAVAAQRLVRVLCTSCSDLYDLAAPIIGDDGKILIDDVELLLERDISFNETQVLAKDAEEQLLYRDMRSDIVQQVVRRLAAVKSL